ncbi:MAG: type I restriction enzyme HsdR N-terminal domain-containing protein [Muribaculaceae bacterium]|nr:type I restriction enzyme HsdR N-terminal domain-containing protein [Muribaculaceae bacterium]MDE6842607.1 type I restriction enzyme HsdR N-terminal domain-containing protein [Muribaculaceae bacterium]MDE7188640.1 type I restriction enzyme HsdR N-terminal domain-containing protein [Muribaculaceae bacterium]
MTAISDRHISGNFPLLNLPIAALRTKEDLNGRIRVFDELRHKWIKLTPEEWVRQNFISWLTTHLHYPSSLIAVETGITLNNTSRRCDTVIFYSDGTPLMIIEYKAPHITISQETFDQIVRYNMVLHTRFLVVSNGMKHYCCEINYTTGSYRFLPSIPDYKDILSLI